MISFNPFSQENNKKTFAFISTEFIVPAENSMIGEASKLNFSFVWGIDLHLKTRFSEKFSMLYGLGYAAVRRNFIFNGFSESSSFAHFKRPIYFQYS